jgi:hypothetical protein
MAMLLISEDEANAVMKVLKGRKVNILMGVGAGSHTAHCFYLGFPDTMVLIDPIWAKEKKFNRMDHEIKLLEHIKDEGTKVDIKEDTDQILKAEFIFQGKKKTVYYYKVPFDPSVIGKFQPDIFHMGHAVIGDENKGDYMSYKPVLKAMLLLSKGTIIMNIDGGAPHAFGHFIYTNYFLDIVYAYKHYHVWYGEKTMRIYKKTRDIDEKENMLIYNFAIAFEELWNQINEEKDVTQSLESLKTFWSAFSAAQRKRLLDAISRYDDQDSIEEALKLAKMK